MRVLIAGSGTIGASLALTCAVHGHATALLGRRRAGLDAAMDRMEHAASELRAADLAPATFGGWRARVELLADQQAVAADVDLVIEAIAEDAGAKKALFASLEGHLAPTAVLASSTSGLPVDELARDLTDPSRLAVAHFANPPHLMPVVELVPGSHTPEPVMDQLGAFCTSIGKTPVRLRRDIAGHLFNRMQFAMLREAISLAESGIATPEEIDLVVKQGLALRLAEEGPLEKIDLAGLQLVHDVAAYLFPALDCSTRPELLRQMLDEGATGAEQGKGFYDWDASKREAVLRRRNAEVVRHLKKLAS